MVRGKAISSLVLVPRRLSATPTCALGMGWWFSASVTLTANVRPAACYARGSSTTTNSIRRQRPKVHAPFSIAAYT
jgi:hypothetical protein